VAESFARTLLIVLAAVALAICCAQPVFAESRTLAVLRSAPVAWHTRDLETDEQRSARLGLIAQAVDAVSAESPKAWGALIGRAVVLAVMDRESHFDPIIHAGGVHPVWHQDRGRAKCLGQIHRTAAGNRWSTLAGADYAATERCAREILRQLARARWCATPRDGDGQITPWVRVFSAYGSGAGCAETPAGRAKAARFSQFLAELSR
jgi:hypothetical protein